MPGRGKASRGKGKGAPTSSTAVTRKRKAEEAENEQEHEDVEHEEEGEDDEEVTLQQWKSPGESDWDDTPPHVPFHPRPIGSGGPIGDQAKNMGRGVR